MIFDNSHIDIVVCLSLIFAVVGIHWIFDLRWFVWDNWLIRRTLYSRLSIVLLFWIKWDLAPWFAYAIGSKAVFRRAKATQYSAKLRWLKLNSVDSYLLSTQSFSIDVSIGFQYNFSFFQFYCSQHSRTCPISFRLFLFFQIRNTHRIFWNYRESRLDFFFW